MGPAEVLQLAILGGIARGPVEIEDLVYVTQSLGGGFWHPTVEVVTACLQALEAQSFITIDSIPVPASEIIVRLTDKGADHLVWLIGRDTDAVPEPLYHCLLGIKIGLLDFLAPVERRHQITIMVERLKKIRETIRAMITRCPRQRVQLRNVIGFEEHRLETEIKWLVDLRDTGTTPAGQPTVP